jgi:hypothetical protein
VKANRSFRARAGDAAGAEVVGSLVLFGIFVATIAFLNMSAVPAAGRSAEEEHYGRVVASLNGLQTEAETAGLPGSAGATVARSIEMGPESSSPKDFFSFFMATPVRASGEISFAAGYGNVTVTHATASGTVVDVGNQSAAFPYGRLTFDPHPVFREQGILQLENGGIVATGSAAPSMRFAPPILVTPLSATETAVAIHVRAFNGSSFDIGGVAPVRVQLVTEAATLSSPSSPNAQSVTFRIETDHGPAWGSHLNSTTTLAGFTPNTVVSMGTGEGGLDVVTWTFAGTNAGAGNDIRLTTGLAIYRLAAG